MKSKNVFCFLALGILSITVHALPNISGEYNCIGKDSHNGKYNGVVTLTLDKENITKSGVGYNFNLAEGSDNDKSTYNGFAAFDGKHLAIYFANDDTSKNDYGVGIAIMTGNKFTKFYYEPKYANSGSTGNEVCTKKK